MRRLLRSTCFAAFACTPLAAGFGPAAEAGDCRPGAIERLRASAPEGFAVYQEIKDKKFFLGWISCGEAQLGLPTAVHESVHYITAELDAFPLLHGGQLKRPHEVSGFFAPSLIAAKFKSSDFVTTYLRPGSASSSTDFLYLLDELNAYTHDLNTAVDLSRSRGPAEQGDEVDHRDGLAALMAFVALYAARAEQSEPATWSGLLEPRVARTVSELWGRAEKVMASSCGIPNFGTEDKSLIRQFCHSAPQAALQKILGRAPVCPAACLKSTPVATLESKPRVDMMPTGSLRPGVAAKPGRPF
ncbi:hypothetical protein [Bradyrhizobium sp.]|jgi:hypothetical protein|uniref:hypothetical protein n=1 Tax=Bradyrhizobium sp. TaxID=376 RepID=UPI002E089AD0|nr:hypothetical protein [Bradyrhizobium sp.]